MNPEQDFEDFVDLLNKHRVNYLIVGGYASGYQMDHLILKHDLL